jgi:hypothetical protein
MSVKRILGILISTVLSASAASASASASEDDGFKLLKSAVCDPPMVHSDDPLGIRGEDSDKGFIKVPAAFVIKLAFEFKTSKLAYAEIVGSLNEKFKLISTSKNEISLSAPNPKIIHALKLSKEEDEIWAFLHLVDEIVLKTKCYKTGPDFF